MGAVPRVSVIVVSHNRTRDLLRSLSVILATANPVMVKWPTPVAFAAAYSVHVPPDSRGTALATGPKRQAVAVVLALFRAISPRSMGIQCPDLDPALLLAVGCFLATMFVLDRAAVEDAVRLVLKRKTV